MKSKQSLLMHVRSALVIFAAGTTGQLASAQEDVSVIENTDELSNQSADVDTQRAFLTEQLATQMEETVVLGKLQSAAGDIVLERMMSEAATDIIGAEQIGRIGDSNVATALRRVPGVTLVNDKFIYVRGLGERYSSSVLNGAEVPSPDLTRSVLPLDIFPASIVESLAVQKTYSADMPAAFGGGNVDIRTKGVPDEFVFSVEIGTSYNTDTSGNGLSYSGGDDDWLGTDDGTRALPSAIESALNTYGGELDAFAIRDVLLEQSDSLGSAEALAQGEEINRELAAELNRNLDIREGDTGQNFSGEIAIGNNWLQDNGMELGVLAGLAYDNSYTSVDSVTRLFSDPDEQLSNITRTTRNVNITGSLALGLLINDDNEIRSTSLFIRNTDDDVTLVDYFDDNRLLSEGSGFQNFEFRYEERELVVNQLNGEHIWSGETRELLGLGDDFLSIMDGLEFDWYYSVSEATTSIPGEAVIEFQTSTDPNTGEVLDSVISISESMVQYRYTDLEDEVDSYGYSVNFPMYFDSFTMDLSGGWDYDKKARTYRQTDLILGSTNSGALLPVNDQPVASIFSDENVLDPDFGIAVNVSGGSADSYLAAVTNEALYGKVDINWEETWRFILGARYEEYSQVGVPWQPLNPQGQIDQDDLEDAAFQDDGIYPSAAVVWMLPDFFAETYQLRLSYSETVVRPDLREITETSYQNPLNPDELIFGNPDVIPSDIANLDLRSEWFFSNGDNLTLSLFYKDIDNPIEFYERPASDRKRASQIQNAESGEIYGLEIEWLKDLSSLGDAFAPFFLQGNLTISDSELVAGDELRATLSREPTNPERSLSGASDHVVNLQVGFDSDDGKHAATLVYNVFGERVSTAGIGGSPDTFESPFNSVDLTYSYYPTYNTTLKFKLKNILDESLEFEQGGVIVSEEKVGLTANLDLKWEF